VFSDEDLEEGEVDDDYEEEEEDVDVEEYYEDDDSLLEVEFESNYEDESMVEEEVHEEEKEVKKEVGHSKGVEIATVVESEITMVPETQIPETQVPAAAPADPIPEILTPTIPITVSLTESPASVPEPSQQQPQTQTPPITPEHLPSRKRPHPNTGEDQQQQERSSTTHSTPPPPFPSLFNNNNSHFLLSDIVWTRPIAPLRQSILPLNETLFSQTPPGFPPLDTTLVDSDLPQQELFLPAPQSEEQQQEQASKRRKTGHDEQGAGWIGVAKTVGKYSLAGVIGGIATVVGLAWNAGA